MLQRSGLHPVPSAHLGPHLGWGHLRRWIDGSNITWRCPATCTEKPAFPGVQEGQAHIKEGLHLWCWEQQSVGPSGWRHSGTWVPHRALAHIGNLVQDQVPLAPRQTPAVRATCSAHTDPAKIVWDCPGLAKRVSCMC